MLRKWIIAVSVLIVSAMVLNVGYYLFFPDVSKLKGVNPRKTAFMEFREQEWRKQGKKKKIISRWVPLARVSPYAIKAVIIAEDDKFWTHEGFDFKAIQKALEKDLRKGRLKAGGSTISQQLAKNLYLSPSKNPVRKLKEAILTWRIERHLSKRRIIEIYLNVAEWGEGIFGIEAATNHYFRKPALLLSAEEAAKLAAVLPNPRRFNPIGSGRYVMSRSERIYQIMVRRGIVIPEYEELMSEPEEETAVPEMGTPEESPKAENDATDGVQKDNRREDKPAPGPAESVIPLPMEGDRTGTN
jgi:monofunctional biosynthetic peptidoglycan transglycosylase